MLRVKVMLPLINKLRCFQRLCLASSSDVDFAWHKKGTRNTVSLTLLIAAMTYVVFFSLLNGCYERKSDKKMLNSNSLQSVNDQELNKEKVISDIFEIDFTNHSFPSTPQMKKLTGLQECKLSDGALEIKLEEDTEVVLRKEKSDFEKILGVSGKNANITVLSSSARSAGVLGTGRQHHVYIYGVLNNKLKLLWCFDTGDRADGGFRNAYGENENLVIETYNIDVLKNSSGTVSAGASCCAKNYVKAIYEWTGSRFQLISAVKKNNNSNAASPQMD